MFLHVGLNKQGFVMTTLEPVCAALDTMNPYS